LAVPPTSLAKKAASSQSFEQSSATPEPFVPRLFTRAEALSLLKIGETTLHWLQRTGKLKPIRIGSRVLFNSTEIMRIAAHGATLTGAEKEAAAKRDKEATIGPPK
jgi:Helix-turn-helix domain